MENITMTNTTQITRVRFAWPQIANRGLAVHNLVVENLVVDRRNAGVGKAFQGTGLSAYCFDAASGFGADLRISAVTLAPSFHAPMHKALAVKDVAYLRSGRPPV